MVIVFFRDSLEFETVKWANNCLGSSLEDEGLADEKGHHQKHQPKEQNATQRQRKTSCPVSCRSEIEFERCDS